MNGDGPACGPETGRGRRLPRQTWSQAASVSLPEKRDPFHTPVPSAPLISADTAAKALHDYFLANADRGDNAANDGLVDALVRRIRAERISSEDSH